MTEFWIGTFNIAAGLQPNKNRLKKWLTQQKIDILGLQEVDEWTKRNPYSMVKNFEEMYSYSYFSKALSFEEGEYGNAILSNLPILNKSAIDFKEFGLEKRVYQKVLIEINNKQLSLYNTHLSFESQEIRRSQVNELLDTLREDTSEYKIILGDFNMDQNRDEWQLLSEYDLVNGYQDKWLETFTALDESMKNYAIDNIILSKNIKIVEIHNKVTNLSDHSLLTTKIRLL